MSHKDACKIQVTELVKKRLEEGLNKTKAFKEVSKEADGIPYNTIKRWCYESGEFSFDTKKDKTKQTVPTFNLTNKSVSWSKYSLNIQLGCWGPDGTEENPNRCEKCYAQRQASRRIQAHEKKQKDPFKPQFLEERLEWAKNTPKPPEDASTWDRLCFVSSMGDLFGDWVKAENIKRVLNMCRETPWFTYVFLTKNPDRLTKFEFGSNSWVGASIDFQKRVKPTREAFKKLKSEVRFISVEPMREKITLGKALASMVDWVIIGAFRQEGNKPAIQPKTEWIWQLMSECKANDVKVWLKPNLHFRELPS